MTKLAVNASRAARGALIERNNHTYLVPERFHEDLKKEAGDRGVSLGTWITLVFWFGRAEADKKIAAQMPDRVVAEEVWKREAKK